MLSPCAHWPAADPRHRAFTGGRPFPAAVVALVSVVASAVLTGCPGSKPNPSPTPTSVHASGSANPNPYFPFPQGATWEYDIVGAGTTIHEHAQVVGISPFAQGHKIDYRLTTDGPVLQNGTNTTDLEYTVFDDGHLGAPFSTFNGPIGGGQIAESGLIFPPASVLEKGTTVSADTTTTILSLNETATVHEEAHGEPPRSVVLPAGTFTALPFVIKLSFTLGSIPITTTDTMLLVRDVGIVEQTMTGGPLTYVQKLTRSSLVH